MRSDTLEEIFVHQQNNDISYEHIGIKKKNVQFHVLVLFFVENYLRLINYIKQTSFYYV